MTLSKKFSSPKLRAALAASILVLTAGAFVYYSAHHPAVITQLRHMNPWLLLILLAGYGVFTVALVLIQTSTLAIIKTHLPVKENLLLTSYSSIANFFGPLQSGPGVRLAYLKARYDVKVKDYAFATFLYYGFFALFSGLLLTVNVFEWWQTLLVLAAIIVGSVFVIKRQQKKSTIKFFAPGNIVKLGLATLFQVLVVATIYYIELHSINPSITPAQAMTYTGAANFALFVSLTPGAIGFRESFLLFSQNLHHISSQDILSASLLDRASNIAFLGILFLVTLSLHARDRFSVKVARQSK